MFRKYRYVGIHLWLNSLYVILDEMQQIPRILPRKKNLKIKNKKKQDKQKNQQKQRKT